MAQSISMRIGRTACLVVALCCLPTGGPILCQQVLYEHAGANEAMLHSESVGEQGPVVDLYFPADPIEEPLPAVVFVLGYPDDALSVGPLKDWEPYRSWARLVAAEGMVGVLYSTTEPVKDLRTVMSFLGEQAKRLQVDSERVALWSTSANGAVALKYARSPGAIEPSALVAYTAVLPTPDAAPSAGLISMSEQFGFALPPYLPGEAYPSDLPIYLVRAGRERFPEVQTSIDSFVEYAFRENLRVSVRNYPVCCWPDQLAECASLEAS